MLKYTYLAIVTVVDTLTYFLLKLNLLSHLLISYIEVTGVAIAKLKFYQDKSLIEIKHDGTCLSLQLNG